MCNKVCSGVLYSFVVTDCICCTYFPLHYIDENITHTHTFRCMWFKSYMYIIYFSATSDVIVKLLLFFSNLICTLLLISTNRTWRVQINLRLLHLVMMLLFCPQFEFKLWCEFFNFSIRKKNFFLSQKV